MKEENVSENDAADQKRKESDAEVKDRDLDRLIVLAEKENFGTGVLEDLRRLRRRGPKLVRNMRDSLFTALFRKKRYVLELYRCLHPEDKDVRLEDVRITTLRGTLTGGSVRNDLGFMVRDEFIILVEAQSTWSENITYRVLQYLVNSLEDHIFRTHQSPYQRKAMKLPLPSLYVLFPGIQGPAELSLAETFYPGKVSPFDCVVKCVYTAKKDNILGQYMRCAEICAEAIHKYGVKTMEAAMYVRDKCNEEDILTEFLAELGGELMSILGFWRDEEAEAQLLRAEKYQSEKKGEKKGREEMMRSMLEKGLSPQFVSEIAHLPVEEVKQLQDSCNPD